MNLCTPEIVVRLRSLLSRYGLTLVVVEEGRQIPGSYWGAPEAGIIRNDVYVRPDTPLHSALHETSHVICMDPERRAQLHTDAGGEYAEEDAVCYLQIVLAGELGLSLCDICGDMDKWGYTFRLGSAQAWYQQDAGDARNWLYQYGLLGQQGSATYMLRTFT